MKKKILFLAGCLCCIFSGYAQTVTDYDGNLYHIITLGTEDWLKENLKVTHYNNGDPVPLILDNSIWSKLTTGAYSYYNNNLNNSAVYGNLYNWFAINDERNVCPSGWHVPTYNDWTTLFDYLKNNGYDLGGGSAIAKSLAFTSGWRISETAGTVGYNQASNNSTGFSALPGGERGLDGNYYDQLTLALWWYNSNESPTSGDNYFYLSSFNNFVQRSVFGKTGGLSVRCVRNSETDRIRNLREVEEIRVYPNPASGKIYICYPREQDALLKIYNMTGECVYTEKLRKGRNETDISFLSKGMYVITVTGDERDFQKKLIKE